MPKYQKQKVNKRIRACARFLIEERIDFAFMKPDFNGLNNENMPENLHLKKNYRYGKFRLC